MADPDFAADEEILKGADYDDNHMRCDEGCPGGPNPHCSPCGAAWDDEKNECTKTPRSAVIPTLAAIARKYQRALRETLFALDEVIGTKRSDAWGNAVNRCRQSRAEVRRILGGGEE